MVNINHFWRFVTNYQITKMTDNNLFDFFYLYLSRREKIPHYISISLYRARLCVDIFREHDSVDQTKYGERDHEHVEIFYLLRTIFSYGIVSSLVIETVTIALSIFHSTRLLYDGKRLVISGGSEARTRHIHRYRKDKPPTPVENHECNRCLAAIS